MKEIIMNQDTDRNCDAGVHERVCANDHLMPKNRRDDDIFIVSYPRSGNTFISFIIANLMVEKLLLPIEVNFFNLHGFIPDIHQGREIPDDMGYFPFKRVIKSHSDFHPDYKNIIYIIRDPRSVMVSYYKYRVGLGNYTGEIGDFIRDKNYGIGAWISHVQSWLDEVMPGTRFVIFKYEDLISEPGANIFKLAKLLGFTLSKEELQAILTRCSFENMQKLEEETGSFSLKKVEPNFKFVRCGSLKEWEVELRDTDLDYIERISRKFIDQFSYPFKSSGK
jgi:hypothetical protein